MERSKFPYTARSSAKVIRHAVSIDERRAKFRQDLMYQSDCKSKKQHEHRERHHHRDVMGDMFHDIHEKYRHHPTTAGPNGSRKSGATETEDRGRRPSQPGGGQLDVPGAESGEAAPFRRHSRSVSRTTRNTANDTASSYSSIAPFDGGEYSDGESDDDDKQDIDEIWFAGGHGDVGGGWEVEKDTRSTSHVPLVWMVREAMKAGLAFDIEKVVAMGCSEALGDVSPDEVSCGGDNGAQRGPPLVVPDILVEASSPYESPDGVEEHRAESHDTSPTDTEHAKDAEEEQPSAFRDMMHKAHCARIHDSLSYDCGMSIGSVLSWKIMEYMPFRRMDLQEDGTWTPIRWPLPCGEVRDIPHNVRVHGSVIRRMKNDPSYRPGNLIVGGGGRGCRVAPESYGIGEWECVAHPGDPVSEVWKKRVEG